MNQIEKQILNCFKSINVLYRGSSMNDLAVRLGISGRSAYRYLEILKNIGFLFEQTSDHKYKIIDSGPKKHLNFSFTKHEVDEIMKLLPEDLPIRKSIRDKLYIHSDILQLPNKGQSSSPGLNRTMLELKFDWNHNELSQQYCLNRTMLELKFSNFPHRCKPEVSLNRTMLELKLLILI